VSLDDLSVLYDNAGWKGSEGYGGNRWSENTRAVIAWRDAIDADDAIRESCLRSEIHGMQHNTDGVLAKLKGVDAAISLRLTVEREITIDQNTGHHTAANGLPHPG
jgi:hypothetical protein